MPRKATKRDAIDQAAIEVIGRRGFARATTQEIATRAGVSEGLLYRYYKSKADMGLTLFKKHYVAILTLLRDVAQKHDDPIESIRVVTKKYYEWFDANNDIARFIIITQHDFLDMVEEDQAFINLSRETLKHVVGEPLFHLFPVDILSAMVVGAFLQVSIECIHGQVEGPLAPRMEGVIETFTGILSQMLPPSS